MKPRTKQPKRPCGDGCYGKMPACAPLATPYVPYQMENPPQYDARKAFVRGTIYPGLDLPFMGMVNNRLKPDTLKSQIQTLAFAVQELSLYLDTHREDTEALEIYRSYQKMLQELKARYQMQCGPLSHEFPDKGSYRWLDDPWPWEYCANMEG